MRPLTPLDGVELAGGQLGAVLSAPRTGATALAPGGPWLATSLDQARQVLTDPARFDFPGDVSRSGDLSGSLGDTRSGHTTYPTLTPPDIARGVSIFEREWNASLAAHDRAAAGEPYDAMQALRRPIARSVTGAVLPALDQPTRDQVGNLVLDWIDALGPVIAAHRPPRRSSRVRRTERRTRIALEDLLGGLPVLDQTPQQAATLLAAGIQVPIAAGSFLLAWLAKHSDRIDEPAHAVWEVLRLTPPTWLVARVTTTNVELGGTTIPAGQIVFVSPLLLGRLAAHVPGDPESIPRFDPDRWRDGAKRPGAWLPFGAGPHACPGRSLGMAMLTWLAGWASQREISLSEEVVIDQSRGIAPATCRFIVEAKGGHVL